MKKAIMVLVYGVLVSIGIAAGGKLWDEVLEDKIDDLKLRFTKKED